MKDTALSKQLFTTDNIKDIDSHSVLLNFYRSAVINSLAVVLWRSPGDKQKFAIRKDEKKKRRPPSKVSA